MSNFNFFSTEKYLNMLLQFSEHNMAPFNNYFEFMDIFYFKLFHSGLP